VCAHTRLLATLKMKQNERVNSPRELSWAKCNCIGGPGPNNSLMEPHYCTLFSCRDTSMQSFSCSCYILSWGGTTHHFLSISVFATALTVLSSTPSNTRSVRAEMRYELEEVWILRPTARDHYTEHFKVLCHLALVSFYHMTFLLQKAKYLCFLSLWWFGDKQHILFLFPPEAEGTSVPVTESLSFDCKSRIKRLEFFMPWW